MLEAAIAIGTAVAIAWFVWAARRHPGRTIYDWRVRREGDSWLLEADEDGSTWGVGGWMPWGSFGTLIDASAEGRRYFGTEPGPQTERDIERRIGGPLPG